MSRSGKRTKREPYTALELYELCCEWTQWRRLSFPKWDKEEIENEAFVIASGLMPQYDYERASLPKFLDIRLYEPMRRSYARSVGMKITRSKLDDGSYGPRVFKQIYQHLNEIGHIKSMEDAYHNFDYPSDLPTFPPAMRDLVQLLAQGKNQRQAASILGVTEGMISLRVKDIRNYLLEQHKLGYSHW